MKKAVAVLAGLTLTICAAFAEGYVNANDLEKGSFKADVALEDGFVLHATEAKALSVDDTELPPAPDGEVFTKRINTKGAGSAEYRSVSFPVKAGEKVTIYGISGSKTDTRTVAVVDEAGTEVFAMDVGPYPADITGLANSPIAIQSFKAAADGTLYAFSKSGGVYIYLIKIEK